MYTTTATVMAFKAWISVKAVHILLALLVLTSQCVQNCVAAEKQCDATHSCPADTTCCCVMPIGVDICVSWGCCPLPGATCCPDHRHCCPANLPICDEVAIGLDAAHTEYSVSVKKRKTRDGRRVGIHPRR